MTRVVVADDQALVRAGLKMVLEAEADSRRLPAGAAPPKILVLTTFDEEGVLMKLSLRDRVHAVVFACEHGIVTPGDDAGA